MQIFRTAFVIFLTACAGIATAQTYPVKTIRWIVPFPPGGGADIQSRMLHATISEGLGQQIVIDNRPGAVGNIGAELAAKSPPDGYTLLFAYSGTHSINRSIYAKMPFQESDFAPVIWAAGVPQVVAVHPSLPVKIASDLIILAKSKPGQLMYGSAGNGSINHLAGELFKMMTGTKMNHVPYKGGGPAAIALLSGEVGLTFSAIPAVVPHSKSGRLRLIAVTTLKRTLSLPALPTLSESGVPGYDVNSWNGMLVPAGTSQTIITRLNTEFNKAISSPEIKRRMITEGFEPVGGEPRLFSELIRTETEKWAKVVKIASMKID